MRFLRSFLFLALANVALATSGCTLLVDGALAGRTDTDAAVPDEDAFVPPTDSGMVDAGPPVGACTGMGDGIRCMPEGIIEPFVCIDQVCVLSTCGDGARDDRSGSMHTAEDCDDGNAVPDDGCEPDCTFSCTADADCDDLELCSGVETCSPTTHACVAGTLATDGTACTITGTTETAACRSGLCRAGVCPDGIVDPGEECDPTATPVDGDGCEADCTFTCTEDFQCADGDACNGNEICNTEMHLCEPADEPRDCDDTNPCTTDTCDPTAGCSNSSVLVDADGDGHPATTASCGGDDCDDANAARYPGATEACGATMDLNCDGMTGVTPTYYRDCDNDTFAASTSGSTMSCTEPAPASGCTGGWTTIRPGTGSTDCLDTSSSARPTQTGWYSSSTTGLAVAYDYNCSAAQEREYSVFARPGVRPPSSVSTACDLGHGAFCVGDRYWIASALPACGSTTATLSQCIYYAATIGLPGTPAHCERETRTSTVRCH